MTSLMRKLNTCAFRRRSYSNRGQQESVLPSRTTTSHNNNAKNNNDIPPYFWIFFGGCTTTIGVAYYSYLDVVPVTGRKRWIVTTSNWESKLGDEEYYNLLEQYRANILSPNHRASSTVVWDSV
jgi:hypothetical protein